MNLIDKLEYNKPLLIESWKNHENRNERIYFSKAYFYQTSQDQFFLKCFIVKDDGTMDCIGYIYFYLNHLLRESKFIGAYIKPEYRGKKFSSLLVAYWIKFCLENNFDILTTNKRQRKPFLIYLLKQYYFEIEDKTLYQTSPHVITICSGEDPLTKYLLFKNKGQQDTFLKGAVFREDNYKIVDEESDDITVLDEVLLSTPYLSQDNDKAYARALKKHEQKELL